MKDRGLRRKLTFYAHGMSLVLIKRPEERIEHVLQKALLWAMYLPHYPGLRVEVPLPTISRYKPDLLALDDDRPIFWAECGVVSSAKLSDILRRYRATHFVFSKWAISLTPFERQIDAALRDVRRAAPVELIRFPATVTEAVTEGGTIVLPVDGIERRQWT
jgi:hypothetical protein